MRRRVARLNERQAFYGQNGSVPREFHGGVELVFVRHPVPQEIAGAECGGIGDRFQTNADQVLRDGIQRDALFKRLVRIPGHIERGEERPYVMLRPLLAGKDDPPAVGDILVMTVCDDRLFGTEAFPCLFGHRPAAARADESRRREEHGEEDIAKY